MTAETPGNGEPMAFVITCDCGYDIRGDIEVELLSNARNHIDEAHPERNFLSDEDLLGMAERHPAG